jgi:hypothetical protein
MHNLRFLIPAVRDRNHIDAILRVPVLRVRHEVPRGGADEMRLMNAMRQCAGDMERCLQRLRWDGAGIA